VRYSYDLPKTLSTNELADGNGVDQISNRIGRPIRFRIESSHDYHTTAFMPTWRLSRGVPVYCSMLVGLQQRTDDAVEPALFK